ncbi:MAG: tetratricopeptide repeat protein [Pseudomonadales bacterium]|nr:tetratricopeptide repeat protein [Pseudomonadales bacterium]
MDTYRTEEEQIAAIRKFAGEHGVKIITAIVVAIALFFGVQNWQKSQLQSKENASFLYNELSTAITAGSDMTAENRSAFDVAYASLMADHSGSIYASYASLFKAKLDVEAGELTKAEQSLQWVVDANFNKNITALAVLRLARVKSANGQRDVALGLLAKDAGPFTSAYEEAKGDIYLLQDKNPEALIAYKKAQDLKAQGMSMGSQMLKMKVEALDDSQQDKLFPKTAAK